jgi:hypothetical protein
MPSGNTEGAWLGNEHYTSEDELADVARAFVASNEWFGCSDAELMVVAEEKAGGAAVSFPFNFT